MTQVILLALLGTSLALVWMQMLLRSPALARLVADVPNGRSSHTTVVPRGGGVIFSLLFALGMALSDFPIAAQITWSLAVLLLGLVGFIDDTKGLKASTRLALQILSAGLILVGKVASSAEPLQQLLSPGHIVFYLCWLIFTVAMVNFVNFADGINGYVGLNFLASIIPLLWLQSGLSSPLFLPLIPLLASVMIFLVYNLRGKLFMGDSGSTVLGLVISLLCLQPAEEIFQQLGSTSIFLPPTWNTIAAGFLWLPFIIAMVPVIFLDCSCMVVAKKLVGMRFSEPHRQHLYQRIARTKFMGHVRTSVMMAVIQFACGIVFIKVGRYQPTLDLLVFLCFMEAFVGGTLILWHKKQL